MKKHPCITAEICLLFNGLALVLVLITFLLIPSCLSLRHKGVLFKFQSGPYLHLLMFVYTVIQSHCRRFGSFAIRMECNSLVQHCCKYKSLYWQTVVHVHAKSTFYTDVRVWSVCKHHSEKSSSWLHRHKPVTLLRFWKLLSFESD